MCISDNFKPVEPWFLEQGGVYESSQLSSQEIKGIKKFMSDWLRKIGFQNACISFEAKCRPEKIYNEKNFDSDLNLINPDFFMPIESNLRLVGAGGWSSIKSAFNVDFINLIFKISCGIKIEDFEVAKEPIYRIISKDITPSVNAEIESIRIDQNKLNSMENLVEIVLNKSPGDKITIQTCIGWICLADKLDVDDTHLESQINEVLNCIELKFKD